jgi:hypothetical protein
VLVLAVQKELHNTARSAQLWQQMRALSQGVRTGRIDASQFGISPAAQGVSACLEALQTDVDANRQENKKQWKQGPANTDATGGDPGDAMDEG